ncbi:hypothetical protein SUGI_0958750 [Cryptomeria japonica]|nr:hypothetical protein SUGI_0958750 [Cryptomeria japonica]
MAGKINIGVTSLPPDDKPTNIPNLLQALDNNMAPSVIKSLIEEINEREEEHKITSIIVDTITCFGLVVFGVIEVAPKEEKKVRYIPSMPLESNKDGIIEKGEIVRAVDRLLVGEDGTEIRKHVTKLMRSSRDVVKEGGSSFNNYSKFLHQMKK